MNDKTLQKQLARIDKATQRQFDEIKIQERTGEEWPDLKTIKAFIQAETVATLYDFTLYGHFLPCYDQTDYIEQLSALYERYGLDRYAANVETLANGQIYDLLHEFIYITDIAAGHLARARHRQEAQNRK